MYRTSNGVALGKVTTMKWSYDENTQLDVDDRSVFIRPLAIPVGMAE
jgi:hypothetical protein